MLRENDGRRVPQRCSLKGASVAGGDGGKPLRRAGSD